MKKNNKKVLLLHSSNDMYGASKIFLNIIKILNQQDYETHIILPYKGPLDNILKNYSDKIEHYNLGVLRKKYFNLLGLIDRTYNILKSILFLSNYIKKNKIDVVYTNTSTIIAGGFAARLNKISSFVHIHEMPINKLYFTVLKKVLNRISNKVILVSNAVKNHWNFVCQPKVHLVYNAAFQSNNCKEAKKLKKGLIFTSVGRLIPYKGHKYLLEIAKKLINHDPKVIFYIIGDTLPSYKKYELSLKRYVLENNLENNIFFIGFKYDVKSYLKSSNFFIHTAIEPDPLPTVILESISTNTPVISTSLGGAVEILDYGKGGLLIPENDAYQSVNLILKLLYNKKEISQKKSYARKFARKNFSQNQFKENILSLFND